MSTDVKPTVSLAEQLAEANRELGLRRALYPKWVRENRMRQDKADRCIATMEAIRDSIANLLKQEKGD